MDKIAESIGRVIGLFVGMYLLYWYNPAYLIYVILFGPVVVLPVFMSIGVIFDAISSDDKD